MISIPTLKQGGNFFGSEDDGDEENEEVSLGPIGPEQHSNSHHSTIFIILTVFYSFHYLYYTSKRNKKKEDRSPP